MYEGSSSEDKTREDRISQGHVRVPAEAWAGDSFEASEPAKFKDLSFVRPSFSRRGFLAACGAAVGSLFMPQLPGGGVVYAYAAEDSSQPFVIKIIKPYQIGFAAIDPSENKKRIPDVKIEVTSQHTKKTISGVTDAQGEIVFDIRELTEPADELGYRFSGHIKATKDGYRIFETGIMRLWGGSGAWVPTQKLDGQPYAQLITLDGWDIQYNSSSFTRSKGNTKDHTIKVRLWVPKDNSVRLGYWVEGTKWETADKNSSGNLVEFTFSRQLLNSSSNWCLRAGKEVRIWFYVGNSKWYKIATHAEILDAALDTVSTGDKMHLDPHIGGKGGDVPQNIKFKLPAQFVKPFGGAEVDVWTPNFVVKYNFSPFGMFMLGVGMPDFEYSADMDETKDWKFAERKTVAEQYKKQKDKWGDAFKKRREARDGAIDPKTNKQALVYSWDMFAKFKATLSLALMAYGEWDWIKKTNQWNAYLQGMAKAELEMSVGQSFAIWIIPCFIEFKLTMGVKLTAELGFKMKKLDFSTIEWDTDHLGLSVSFDVAFALTLAAGLREGLSLGIRGWGYISFYIGFVPSDEPSDPIPHLTFSAGIGIDWCAQLFIAKFSGKIIGKEWKPITGNWKKDKDKSSAEMAAFDPEDWDFTEGSPFMEALLNAPPTSDESSPDMPDHPEFHIKDADGNAGLWVLGEPDMSTLDGDGNPQGFTLVSNAELLGRSEFNAKNVPNYDAFADTLEDYPHFNFESDDDGDGVNDCLYMWDAAAAEGAGVYVKYAYEDKDGDGTFDFVSLDPSDPMTNGWDQIASKLAATQDQREAYASFLLDEGVEYEYAGTSELGVVEESVGDVGVAAVGETGVKPTMEALICKNVFSDPRVKVIQVAGMWCLFRILPVNIGGQARTRVTISCYFENSKTWSKPAVISFEYEDDRVNKRNSHNYRRIETYDYEFDVVPGNANGTFQLAITSGKRPSGDNTSYTVLMKESIFNYVRCGVSYFSPSSIGLSTQKVHTYGPDFSLPSEHYLNFASPRIARSTNGSNTFFSVAITSGRYAERPKDSICNLFVNCVDSNGNIKCIGRHSHGMDWLPALVTGDVMSSRLVPMGDDKKMGFVAVIASRTYSTVLSTDEIGKNFRLNANEADPLDDEEAMAAAAIENGPFAVGDLPGTDNHTWTNPLGATHLDSFSPGLDGVLYARGGHLYGKSMVDGKEEEVGPPGFNVQTFASSASGKLLYFVENYDGKTAPITNEKGIDYDKPTPEKKCYQLLCARKIENKYSDAFAFGELEHPIDSLSQFDMAGTASGFVFSDTKDLTTSRADIYCTSIPFVKAVTVINFESCKPFVGEGMLAEYALTVRNDGNSVVEKFKIIVQQVNGTFRKEIEIVPSPQNTAVDNDDYDEFLAAGDERPGTLTVADAMEAAATSDSPEIWENPEHDSSGKAGVLVPGRPRTYYCEMTIPEGWKPSNDKGEFLVTVTVDPASIQITTLPSPDLPGSDDSKAGFREEPDIAALAMAFETPAFEAAEIAISEEAVIDVSGANASIVEDHGQDGPPDGGIVFPKTGDDATLTGAAGLVLGAGAAALTAYSARRTKLERQAGDDAAGS